MKEPAMTDTPTKPFLIAKDEDGQVRLTLCETRRNSQGYPWVVRTLLDRSFATAAAARAFATAEYGAKPGEFASR
jgi:hypothetical protein